ncbi:hypothetical protein KRR39_21185 [Nocardioides panacis]|uniref:Uncharacterized protein n=1 Tax=Nocardioides panacis TaxID=2849501 RepID=A0A975Y021_9ACTN|nr:hypothetical protein [Nocardioides panacis]QWZ07864.1 hypothetical protein KRR39_21185 [Nocardioides panacis]
MPAYASLAVLLLVLLAGAVGYFVGRGSATQQAVDARTVDAVRREITALRALVARLKDIAWDQRELDPNLSTIVIDEIRAHEKKELEP